MSDTSSSAPVLRSRASVSFRTSLLRNLMLLIAALAFAILAVSFIGSRNAIRTLCQDLVHSGTDHVESDLRSHFAPIPPVLRLLRDWSESGLLDHEDPQELNRLLIPVLDSLPQIAGLTMGFPDGSGYLLGRNEASTGGGYSNQIVKSETAGKTSTWISGVTAAGGGTAEVREDNYDPRTRPWYLGAIENSSPSAINWTEPYEFFSGGALGITASIPLGKTRESGGVISLDLLLDDVSRLGETLEISPNGFLLVVTEDVKLIGLPGHPKLRDPEARSEAFLKKPSELGIPLFTRASAEIIERFDLKPDEVISLEAAEADTNTPFRWSFEGKGWWSYVRSCTIDDGPLFWIGVAVPESDFLGELEAGRNHVIAISLIALVLAGLISVRLSKRYSQPIQSLILQSERLRVLNTKETSDQRSDILEIGQLYEAQERMRLALDSFAKYVPSEVVRELLDKGEAAVIGGRNTSMSILFTDIAGFTSISERMSPEQLTAHMADYFDAMIEVITEHNGTVDKLIGDAIVAFWGAPKANTEHAHDAVLAALRCEEKLRIMNAKWEAEGLPRLPTRFGISTGKVMVGNIGAVNRLSYTALGDSVNLASRLEGANKYYGTRIIAAETSVTKSKDQFIWRKLDKVRVVGRSQSETIYELLGERGKVSEERLEQAQQYESAFDSYLRQNFTEAIEKLETLLQSESNDLSVTRLLRLCQEEAKTTKGTHWDGVSDFSEK